VNSSCNQGPNNVPNSSSRSKKPTPVLRPDIARNFRSTFADKPAHRKKMHQLLRRRLYASCGQRTRGPRHCRNEIVPPHIILRSVRSAFSRQDLSRPSGGSRRCRTVIAMEISVERSKSFSEELSGNFVPPSTGRRPSFPRTKM